MGLGIGLAFSNARAVIEALLGVKSEFVRTPKYRVEAGDDAAAWKRKQKYRRGRGWLPLFELASAAYFMCAMLYAAHMGLWATLPFLGLFCFGYAYVGTMSLWQTSGGRRLQDLFRPAAVGRR